jgi:hypothetical protein
MEDRQEQIEVQLSSEQETVGSDYVLSQRIRMVGWREHDMLLAEGHYRCPHCRRTDTMETYPANSLRR